MQPSNANKNSQGFTLIETLTVLIILGILAAIAAPSFFSLFNKEKVSSAMDQVRGALQECQREAIRRSKSCTIELDITNKKITGDLLVTGDRDLCEERDSAGNCIKSTVAMATNLSGTPPKITFSFKGNTTNSGKVVVYGSDGSTPKKKCLVISNGIGIMRTGDYSGATALSTDITAGTCTTK